MRLFWIMIGCLLISGSLYGQNPPPADKAPSLKIVIPDEPRAVDPSTVMPNALTKKVTRVFDKISLKDLTAWAKGELQMPVILDSSGLSDLKLLSSEQITDLLQDEPLYVILDRLSLIGLGWYIDDETLYITSLERAQNHYSTRQYVVSDLLDAQYNDQSLISVIERCTSGPWDADEPGTGTIVMLGDVLFVRQLDAVHREVASLLAALRKHGRQTLLLDLPPHAKLRSHLDQLVTLELNETPFDEALRKLGTLLGTTVRIHPSVPAAGIRVRQPLTFQIDGQRLRSAIQEFGSHLGQDLRGYVSHGALWVATRETVDASYSTAVFDVRDLCRDESEVSALTYAIESQTGGPWDVNEPGTGVLDFPIPGTMVCRQNPAQLDEVLKLLEDYRTALRASKPRVRINHDAQITTAYYKMPTEMANDLLKLIPQVVAPDTWLGEKPLGTIQQVASQSELDVLSSDKARDQAKGATNLVLPATRSSRSVLIIRQTNATHRVIEQLISSIQHGSSATAQLPTGSKGFGGGGQGGFGGGFFDMEAKTPTLE